MSRTMYIAKHIRFKEKRCAYSITNDIRILTIQRLEIKSRQRDSSHKLDIKSLKLLLQKQFLTLSQRERPPTINFVCIHRNNNY